MKRLLVLVLVLVGRGVHGSPLWGGPEEVVEFTHRHLVGVTVPHRFEESPQVCK
jgi:hypothetical protein